MGSPLDCTLRNPTPEGSCCWPGGTRTVSLALLSPSAAAAGRDGGVSCAALCGTCMPACPALWYALKTEGGQPEGSHHPPGRHPQSEQDPSEPFSSCSREAAQRAGDGFGASDGTDTTNHAEACWQGSSICEYVSTSQINHMQGDAS